MTRGRALKPFFTTQQVGARTGLGLAMVYGIVQQSGRRVQLEGAPKAGITVALHFPAVSDRAGKPLDEATHAVTREAAREATGEAPRSVTTTTTRQDGPGPRDATRGRTALLVDDEAGMRAVARRVLEGAGYRVLEAEDGAAGLACWRAHATEIALLVTDVRMPVLDGLAFRAAVRADRPGLLVLLVPLVLLMSGCADAAPPDGRRRVWVPREAARDRRAPERSRGAGSRRARQLTIGAAPAPTQSGGKRS